MKFKKYIFQLAGSLQQEDEVTKAARVIDHFPTIYCTNEWSSTLELFLK